MCHDYIATSVKASNRLFKQVVGAPKSLDRHLKECSEMSMAWEPNSRSNFFNPPAYVSDITYMTKNIVDNYSTWLQFKLVNHLKQKYA